MMQKQVKVITIAVALSALMPALLSYALFASGKEEIHSAMKSANITIKLSPAKTISTFSLEKALTMRRSVRDFKTRPLSEAMISQLLWSMQGVTDAGGYRTAPSAGALYPLQTYLANHDGLFHYEPERHELIQKIRADLRNSLCIAALGQEEVRTAPSVFVLTAVFDKTAGKYGKQRGERYIHMECGHAAENLLLQAVALGLGAVPIGSFHDQQISEALNLPSNEHPLYLIPVGYAR